MIYLGLGLSIIVLAIIVLAIIVAFIATFSKPALPKETFSTANNSNNLSKSLLSNHSNDLQLEENNFFQKSLESIKVKESDIEENNKVKESDIEENNSDSSL